VQQNRYGWITVEQVEDGLTVDAFMELAWNLIRSPSGLAALRQKSNPGPVHYSLLSRITVAGFQLPVGILRLWQNAWSIRKVTLWRCVGECRYSSLHSWHQH
jgi:hypothetical protein